MDVEEAEAEESTELVWLIPPERKVRCGTVHVPEKTVTGARLNSSKPADFDRREREGCGCRER